MDWKIFEKLKNLKNIKSGLGILAGGFNLVNLDINIGGKKKTTFTKLTDDPKCSFCEKKKSNVEALIEGPVQKIKIKDKSKKINITHEVPLYICNECLEKCAKAIEPELAEQNN